MGKLRLVIGNKNYSSWSLRPWLLLRHFNVDFEEVRIPLYQADSAERLARYSPSLKVPVLHDGALQIWDSLAICEYVSEQYLQGQGWPGASAARAKARAVSAEMHSGFNEVRSRWPMNVRLQRKAAEDPVLLPEIARIQQLWQQCLEESSGPFLFGRFSIADCMYAPIALRFNSRQPQLTTTALRYVHTLLNVPALDEWIAAAQTETEILARYE